LEVERLASNACNEYLIKLLSDAGHLLIAAPQLPAGISGRSFRLAALNRAVVVSCVSAWEAYLEELIREAINLLRPRTPPFGVWPAFNAAVRGQLGRFNNPNTENVRQLFSDTLGLQDVQTFWAWQNCTSTQAVQRLAEAMAQRHQIAHGVNPRPVVASYYANELPAFFRKLGRCTDRAVRDHLVNVLGIGSPWPI
jgi:hypothetical protein